MFLASVAASQSWLEVVVDGFAQILQFLGNLVGSLIQMLQLALLSVNFSLGLSGFFPSILGSAILFTVAIYIVKLIIGR